MILSVASPARISYAFARIFSWGNVMARLKLNLLGPPRIWRNERAVVINRRKAIGLLAYLVVSRGSHRREGLATLLWPEVAPHRAHANLCNLIWVLKRQVAPEWIHASHETLEFKPDDQVSIDVAEFRTHMRRGRVEASARGISPAGMRHFAKAAEIYQDHFLTGFTLKDSIGFDEWQIQQEEALRAEAADALTRLVHASETGKNLTKAIAYAQKWLALDPYHEGVQRTLMSLLARAGQRGAALEFFEKSRNLLRRELGLPISEETLALREEILRGALEEQAPPEPPPLVQHNLPAQVTPFLGRDRELAHVEECIQGEGNRLVTLTGPGGCGKTRLALEYAARNAGQFTDGVCWVPLAPIQSAAALTSAMVAALRIPLAHGSAGERKNGYQHQGQLRDFLRAKQVLILLDNLEHLLADLSPLTDLLREAPELTLLATSRERLNLSGERVIAIDGLAYPTKPEEGAQANRYPAVRLFEETARRIADGFAPDRSDRQVIASICRQLRGHPLAIELAAAWVRLLSVGEIAREIEADLDFLQTEDQALPARHRSLRAVFEHSWTLLTPKQRTTLRRLALARGPISRRTALAIASSSTPTLAALADKSLLRTRPDGCYEIHELLRQFAEEKLSADEVELAATRDRMCEHYLKRSAALEAAIKGPGLADALGELAREEENLAAAWRHAARTNRAVLMRASWLSLFLFFDIRSRFQEGQRLLGEISALLEEHEVAPDPMLLGPLLAAQGYLEGYAVPAGGQAQSRRSLTLLEPHVPGPELAFALLISILVGLHAQESDQRQVIHASLELFEAQSDRWGTAMALEVFAYIERRHDPPHALRCAQRSLALRRQAKDEWGIALSLYMLGLLAEESGMPRAARKRYLESFALRQRLGLDLMGAAHCLSAAARIARHTGDYAEAQRLREERLRLVRTLGNRRNTAATLIELGDLYLELDEITRAKTVLTEAHTLAAAADATDQMRLIEELLVLLNLSLGEVEEARFHLAETPPPEPTAAPPAPGRAHVLQVWDALGRAQLLYATGDSVAAEEQFRRALSWARRGEDDPGIQTLLVDLAGLRAEAGDFSGAAELLGAAQVGPPLLPRTRKQRRRVRRAIGRGLSPAALQAALERGATRGLYGD